jgi:trk system potassium uptake protein TrkA
MNIILAADGELGLHLAKQLSSENHNITVVNDEVKVLREFERQYDVMTILGDATHIQTLRNAKVNNCDLVISVMHEEQPNIVTASLAKRLGAKRTIARITNPENLSRENRQIFNEIGVDHLVSPEQFAAKEIVKLVNQSAADEIFDFSEGKLSLFLLKLDERAQVINKSLREIDQEHKNLHFRAVAIHRKGKTIIPNGDNRFLLGDLAYIITKPEGINQILELGGKKFEPIRNVMIVGGGRIGKMTAMRLENDINVKLVEIDKDRCYKLSDKLDNTLIINGDSRDLSLLEDEGISSMDAFISVTNDSETNLMTCLIAKKYGVKKTMALVENLDYTDIAQNIGIDTVINKKQIAASYIDSFTLGFNVASIKCLHGVDAEVMEVIPKEGSKITKRPLRELKFPSDAIIGGVVRNHRGHIADGNFQVEADDKVVVFTSPSSAPKVNKFFL